MIVHPTLTTAIVQRLKGLKSSIQFQAGVIGHRARPRKDQKQHVWHCLTNISSFLLMCSRLMLFGFCMFLLVFSSEGCCRRFKRKTGRGFSLKFRICSTFFRGFLSSLLLETNLRKPDPMERCMMYRDALQTNTGLFLLDWGILGNKSIHIKHRQIDVCWCQFCQAQ